MLYSNNNNLSIKSPSSNIIIISWSKPRALNAKTKTSIDLIKIKLNRLMSCFTFYIFNRQGVCQYYHEWSRPKPVQQGAGSIQEDFKLMFGMCWSMKAFAAAVNPKE